MTDWVTEMPGQDMPGDSFQEDALANNIDIAQAVDGSSAFIAFDQPPSPPPMLTDTETPIDSGTPIGSAAPAAAAAAAPTVVPVAAADVSPLCVQTVDSPSGVILPANGDIPNSPAKCPHCQERLADMQESGGMQCQAGARRWELNWGSPGAPSCFGACLSREFCTDHGYPLPTCMALHAPGTRHTTMTYRGMWVMQRRKHDRDGGDLVEDSSPASDDSVAASLRKRVKLEPGLSAMAGSAVLPGSAAASPSAPPQPVMHGRCEECLVRLGKLAAVDWMQTPELAARIAELRAGAATTCQGFCQTSYCCKLHVFPTDVRKEGHPTRFKCPMSHDASKKGRHHEVFAYYCDDPNCCAGRWFSREETHRRTRKGKVAKPTDDEQLYMRGENASHVNAAPAVTRSPSLSGSATSSEDERSEYGFDDRSVGTPDAKVVSTTPDVEMHELSFVSNAQIASGGNTNAPSPRSRGYKDEPSLLGPSAVITDNKVFEASKRLTRVRRLSIAGGIVLAAIALGLLGAVVGLAVRAKPNVYSAHMCAGDDGNMTCVSCDALGSGTFLCTRGAIVLQAVVDTDSWSQMLSVSLTYNSTGIPLPENTALPWAWSGVVGKLMHSFKMSVAFFAYRTSSLSNEMG